MCALSLAIVSISISIAIGDGTETRSRQRFQPFFSYLVYLLYNGASEILKKFQRIFIIVFKSSIGGDEPWWRYVCSEYSAFYTIEPILAIGHLWSAVFATLGSTY